MTLLVAAHAWSILLGEHSESSADSYPLLMERTENNSDSEHVIDITRDTNASPSASAPGGPLEPLVGLSSSALRAPEPVPSKESAPSSNNSVLQRGDGRGGSSPLNSGMWVCIELLLTISQSVVSIVVLALSKHEKTYAPLRAWIVGYASGCVAVLPSLYWRYGHRNESLEHGSVQNHDISVQGTLTAGTRLSLLFTRPSAEYSMQTITSTNAADGSFRYFGRLSGRRLKAIVEYFKMGLDCFFAIWFVVGNVWILGGRSSATEAPSLYWLCIIFLVFSCIGYAMPFILCATICCCFPCIISILSLREDLNRTRGATSESINALPTYKFKLKKNRSGSSRDANMDVEEGGVVAAGTDKELVISAEDAACCICLAGYANNDELRELPCLHFLHKDCVDERLRINASCPLCKREVIASIYISGANQE